MTLAVYILIFREKVCDGRYMNNNLESLKFKPNWKKTRGKYWLQKLIPSINVFLKIYQTST